MYTSQTFVLTPPTLPLWKMESPMKPRLSRVEELQESMDRFMQDYEMCAERRSMSEALEKQKDKDVEQQGMMATPPGMAGVQEGEVKELKKQLAASIWENESSSST